MLNVLVVDDALIIRKNITRFLTGLGHKVVADAKSGAEAVALCKEIEGIDLITMDITMPEMNGIEATKLIKEILPEVSIIMVTSHGQEELVAQSLKAGAKNFILKPITGDKLDHTIGALFPKYAKDDEEELLDDE